ncbi:MAG TPA: HAMP domain-containing sensor histidine kinase [Ornithinimicrobium sp.]|uniref:sensor histidine kinase n=1 Tax=Ornithinimicrobium sp. TaxID=1977084 RepID=UPI002B45D915|nr:HAMP domain-containing sensor histidine kinase [Ornithinimicrobium sp.]HKJ12622.1 HAMP domain-containing sensor histidine kinase [Ornithinimicrobium sp.]
MLFFALAKNLTPWATVDIEPGWLPYVSFVLGVVITVAVVVPTALVLIDRTVATLTLALQDLAQQADDFGTGAFTADPPPEGQDVEPSGRTGLDEIDTVRNIMARSQTTLARALSSERSFAADASHQLRTPLAALSLRLEEVVHTDDLDVAKHEAQIAMGQTERLASVVDDLLHRTRAGHADGGRSVSLDTVLSALEQEWTPSFQARGRQIVVRAERAMIVRSSSSAVSQILNTLVENSLQHGDGLVQVAAARSGPSALLEVRDEGPGMDPELARRVFDRAVTSGSGTGLGLAVARETAESFGGRLELAQAKPAVFALYISMEPAR